MLRLKKESIEWLEFPHLHDEPHIRHSVFLRHGGVSPEPFASLNAGAKEGDASENIRANREKMREVLGAKAFFSGHQQVHGDVIAEAPAEGPIECDGMVTAKPGLGLMINHADCQAALMYDPIRKVVANVHAGWRGQVQNIYAKAVYKLKEMGCRPENLLVGISPSLGPCCAEFQNYERELPRAFWDFQARPLHFDLWEIGRQQLLAAGILPAHLQVACICTKCNEADFFSYRREKMTGRNGTAIVLHT